jgi:hypothetical protein
MTGHPAAEILALWAAADLDPHVTSEVGLHLESCAECRGYVGEIKHTREVLAGCWEEPSEADLFQLRIGLGRSLERRRRTARWCWSLAAAASALVFMFGGVSHRSARVPAVTQESIQLPPLRISMPVALDIPAVKQVGRPRAQRPRAGQDAGLRGVNFVPRADGSTELRLTTADPNVIILLPRTETTVEQ